MSYIKRWLENNIENISEEELLEAGYSKEEIIFMKDSFSDNKENNE